MSDRAGIGTRGEDLAAGYLRQKGFTILERNWHSGRTEIDIIAENSEFIIFVEVKSRSAGFFVPPAEAVSVPKQRTIIFAAANYIDSHQPDKETRFDIITVVINGQETEIEHIENAYYPTL